MICTLFPVLGNPYHRLSSFLEQKPVDPGVKLELFDILTSLPRFYQLQISSWLDSNLHHLFPQDTGLGSRAPLSPFSDFENPAASVVTFSLFIRLFEIMKDHESILAV